MKNILPIFLGLIAISGILAFTQAENSEFRSTKINEVAAEEGELKWYTWEEAVEANKTNPKKIFVDVYTGWCGWCKVMDKKTFPIPEVKSYIEEHFYPVKLDAEQKETIHWNGNKFEWREGGRNGINMLAYSLLEGKTSYPTIVYLNEKFERIMISPGYKTPEQFLPELKYTAEEHYEIKSWEDYKAGM